MKTLGEVLQLSSKFLDDKAVVNPKRMASELLSHVVKLPRIELYMKFDRPMEENELEEYRGYIKRAARGEPWQYIVGEVEFYHCKIGVSSKVLIPRQETEILVSRIVSLVSHQSLKVWDICCGSACIGIALKKACPSWEVALSDSCSDALELARLNAGKNEVLIELHQGDLLKPFEGKKADVIVCNPPYISELDYQLLDKSVRDFEPRKALVGGFTGFECYERLAGELPRFLNSGGKVYFEIGAGMGERVLSLFNASCWLKKTIEFDWAGHDRFIFLEFQ